MPTVNRRLTYTLLAVTLLAAGVGAIVWRGSQNFMKVKLEALEKSLSSTMGVEA